MKIFGEHEPNVIQQLQNCLDVEEGSRGVLCADGHLGYCQPIGGAVAYRNHVSPSGVGYDIGCGNKAVQTNLHWDDIEPDIARIMDEIVDKISFGVGRKNAEPVEHPVLDRIRDAEFAPQRQLLDLAAEQLGTVGAGNHYVDIFRDTGGWIWVGVHFGSRGFGHKTASGFLALAEQDRYRRAHPEIPWVGSIEKHFFTRGKEGEMMSKPIVLSTDSDLGQAYIQAMTLAGDYAYAGRDVVVERVLEILGADPYFTVHNHHNYAWQEEHDGEMWWVVRKGCTPAFPGQQGFVGATMGEDAVILTGTAYASGALFSTVHGAGRVMSRTAAAGKLKVMAVCSDRDCDYRMPWGQYRSETEGLRPDEIVFCPLHQANRALKRRVRTQAGAIDWDATLIDMDLKGIQLRGGAADEAPGAYKRLTDVLAAQGDTIRIDEWLTPVGVAMAGADTFDPYKD